MKFHGKSYKKGEKKCEISRKNYKKKQKIECEIKWKNYKKQKIECEVSRKNYKKKKIQRSVIFLRFHVKNEQIVCCPSIRNFYKWLFS